MGSLALAPFAFRVAGGVITTHVPLCLVLLCTRRQCPSPEAAAPVSASHPEGKDGSPPITEAHAPGSLVIGPDWCDLSLTPTSVARSPNAVIG